MICFEEPENVSMNGFTEGAYDSGILSRAAPGYADGGWYGYGKKRSSNGGIVLHSAVGETAESRLWNHSGGRENDLRQGGDGARNAVWGHTDHDRKRLD